MPYFTVDMETLSTISFNGVMQHVWDKHRGLIMVSSTLCYAILTVKLLHDLKNKQW